MLRIPLLCAALFVAACSSDSSNEPGSDQDCGLHVTPVDRDGNEIGEQTCGGELPSECEGGISCFDDSACSKVLSQRCPSGTKVYACAYSPGSEDFAAVQCEPVEIGSSDDGAPVASTPLEGTIDGRAFSGRSALGYPNADGSMSISVYDDFTTCDRGRDPEQRPKRLVELDTPWVDGETFQLDSERTATIVSEGTGSLTVTLGRVEVLRALAETGTVRVRANVDDDNHVEGEVSLLVCE